MTGSHDAPRRPRWLVGLIATLGVLVACQCLVVLGVLASRSGALDQLAIAVGLVRGTPPPDAPAELALAPRAGPLLIEERFAAPAPRWDQSLVMVRDGALVMNVANRSFDSYTLYLGPPADDPAAETFDAGAVDDFDLSVDVRQTEGDARAAYGIRFRQTGPEDYLMFAISSDGFARLVRVRAGEHLALVPWRQYGAIRRGVGAANRLRLVAQGASLVASVNDVPLITADDAIDVGGQLTLGVQTSDAGGATVAFEAVSGTVGALTLDDSFDGPAAVRWSVGGATLSSGGYEIIIGAGVQTWQQPMPVDSSRVAAFTADVSATLLQADGAGAAYGLVFGDGGNFDFYSLLLFPEGEVAVIRSSPTAGTEVLVPRTALPEILTEAGATNELRVSVAGSILTLTINHSQIGEVDLGTTVVGRVGVIVSAGDAGMTRVRFDDFVLRDDAAVE